MTTTVRHSDQGGTAARARSRGLVLLVVLVIIAMVSMIAASLLYQMTAAKAAARADSGKHQAFAAAMSGVETAIQLLLESEGDPAEWFDNPDVFHNRYVATHGEDKWYFTIYAPSDNPDSEQKHRYGLTDESGKVSLNTAREDMLLAMPSLTTEQVDALMDYRDSDSEQRASGAEQEYYDRLPFPYRIPNGALATVEETLLVKGFTAKDVYGEDANYNGVLDANEDDGDESFPPDDGDGQLDPGLRGLFTSFSYAPNVDSEGKRRIDINTQTNKVDSVGLSQNAANFIKQVRADGHVFKDPSELLEMSYEYTKPVKKGQSDTRPRQSQLTGDDLAIVMDKLSTDRRRVQIGRININAAPRGVLKALPGIDDAVADRIISSRRTLENESKKTVAWLYNESILDAEKFKQVAPLICARGYQYKIRCIGYGYPSGRYRIIEAVIDVGRGRPRMLYFRDITRLGLPFALDPEKQET